MWYNITYTSFIFDRISGFVSSDRKLHISEVFLMTIIQEAMDIMEKCREKISKLCWSFYGQ